ncbi:hypothetical protein AU374_03948 [Cupriavidus metallidurans]|nr:hypothetical protein AU374_03948 [Cupriavidus metallidurans]
MVHATMALPTWIVCGEPTPMVQVPDIENARTVPGMVSPGNKLDGTATVPG